MSALTSNRGVPGRVAYTVVCPLGSGGMGRVDLVARHEGPFLRLFAQKRLRADLVDDPEVNRMLVDEARIAGLVDHPNVVSVVDVGDDQRGPFLIMDFVDGASLSELIEAAAARGERLPVELCLRVAKEAAEGLHALHELRGADGEPLQLVHRDVSPQNILVGFDGLARVTDFGVAKARGRTARTTAGVLKGKVGYLSPEQLRFEEPDRRADLFALGVVLFEMLAGRRLYESGGDMDGPRRILHEPPPDLAEHRDDVEPELVELLFELLAKDRGHRPPDARTVARRLDDILGCMVVEAGARGDTGAHVQRLFGHKREALRRRIAEELPPTGAAGNGPRRKTRLFAGGATLSLAVLATVALWRGVGPRRTTIEAATTAAVASPIAGTSPLSVSVETPVETPVPALAPPRVAAASTGSAVRRHPARRRSPRAEEDCRLPGARGVRGDQRFDVDCLIKARD